MFYQSLQIPSENIGKVKFVSYGSFNNIKSPTIKTSFLNLLLLLIHVFFFCSEAIIYFSSLYIPPQNLNVHFLPSSQENSSESITSSSRGESGRSRQNGSSSRHSPQDGSSESLNSRKEKGALVSEKKVQVMSRAAVILSKISNKFKCRDLNISPFVFMNF